VVDCSTVADDVESFGPQESEAASGTNPLSPAGDVAVATVAGSSDAEDGAAAFVIAVHKCGLSQSL
jgi:hypothetical protein